MSPGFDVDRRGVPRGFAPPWREPAQPALEPCRRATGPRQLVDAYHEACGEHSWVTLMRGGARFHVVQCSACYAVDFAELEAQVDAELPIGYGPR